MSQPTAAANQGEVAYGKFRHVQVVDFVREMVAELGKRWIAWQAIRV